MESLLSRKEKGGISMRAWKLYGINDLRYEECEMPSPKEGQVLLGIKAAGICGSDVPRVFDTGAHRHPLIIGHEFSGVVEAVGPGVDKALLHQRSGVFPLIPCRRCLSCRQGLYEMCSSYDYLGSRCDGGFAEYVCVPAENLIEIPGNVSFEEAAMLEPMAVAAHAMRRGTVGLKKESIIALCGFGTIGMLLTVLLLEAGYRNIYVIGNKDFQRERAMAMGISEERWCDSRRKDVTYWLQENAGGAYVFFECTGRNQVLSWGVDSARPGGRVVLVGNPFTDMTLERAVYWKLLRNQLTVTGIWNSSFTGENSDDWHYVLKRLAARCVEPAQLITHRFPLEQLWDGLAIMREKMEDYGKIMIYPESR